MNLLLHCTTAAPLLLRSLAAVSLSATLAACATLPEGAEEPLEEVEITAVESQPEPVEVEYGNFTEEQLYQAIISEIGAKRGQVKDAGENYFDLAFETRDMAIVERALQFALVANDVNALLQLGLLWAEIRPENPRPHLMLSFQFLESGAFEQALSHMARVIDLGGSIDFSTLATRTGRLDPQGRAGLIDNLRQLVREFPQQESIHIALIQLLGQSGEPESALQELNSLKDRFELRASVVVLEAQLLQNLDRGDAVMRTLRIGVRNFETDRALRLTFARFLIQSEEYADAIEQFEILVEQDPEDWETYYSIALLDMEIDDYDSAIGRFTRLIGVDQHVDESQYYLGLIYQESNQLEKAIGHYRQVRIGTDNFLSAQQQATRFSVQLGELEDAHAWLSRLARGQPRLDVLFITIESSALIQAGYGDEALELLNTGLNNYPNEADLLFARVLYHDSIQNREGSERDLRQIIQMQPEDSRALNHLGYMLADQSSRFDEALELLQRAIAIAPDDAAIIDSLAWVQYKLGQYEAALTNLRRAFVAFPDHEVASHLGEVLWVMGRRDEALQVWEDALETTPDSELIKEAMERLRSQS
jgi:tetratricopeptide (TPR) repeat protein